MIVRQATLAITVAACGIGALGREQTLAAAPPKSLVLQTSDLTRVYAGTFHKGLGIALGPTGFGGVTVGKSSTLTQHGFVAGYSVIYERMSGTQFGVTNAVSAFRDSSGPRWELNYALQHMPKPGTGQAIHISPVSGIGDGGLMYTTTIQIRNATHTVGAGVAFIRGRYAITIGVIDTSGPNRGDIVSLAKVEDAKIQHQG